MSPPVNRPLRERRGPILTPGEHAMIDELLGRKVAILVMDGFEQIELTSPREALERAGAITHILTPGPGGKVRGWHQHKPADEFDVDASLEEASPDEYDALLLPGGLASADQLRQDPRAVEFARELIERDKPVSAISHGIWLLIEADVVQGRRVTSCPSLRTDLVNAGAQ
ncbi:MAG TPA: DJ-1/PfpI family protein, partial [Phycisphaeraceae bacterium]